MSTSEKVSAAQPRIDDLQPYQQAIRGRAISDVQKDLVVRIHEHSDSKACRSTLDLLMDAAAEILTLRGTPLAANAGPLAHDLEIICRDLQNNLTVAERLTLTSALQIVQRSV